MAESVVKCPRTQLPCGFLGMFCPTCADNPKNTGEFEAGWQSCPVCQGSGKVENYLLGLMEDCSVCKGKMIINIKTGKPPHD